MLDYVTDTEVAEQYDWGGASMRGCEAADYPGEVSACEGQKLGGRGAKGPLASLVLLPLDRCVARLVVNIINVSSG